MKNVKNIVCAGMSGKIRDIVFYQLNGKTFARKAPGSYNKIPTEKQAASRQRFIAANEFAKSAISDPELKAMYEAKGKKKRTAYIMAMKDYLANH